MVTYIFGAMHEDEIARLQRCIQAKVKEIIALGREVHRLRSERDEDLARAMGYSTVKEAIEHQPKRPKR
jgi:hypothetical protein